MMKIVIGLLVLTMMLFVWAWCKAAGDADDQADRQALEANRRRLHTLRKTQGTSRP